MTHAAYHFPSAVALKDALSDRLFAGESKFPLAHRGIVGVGVRLHRHESGGGSQYILDVYWTSSATPGLSRPEFPSEFGGLPVLPVRVPGFPKLAYGAGPRGRVFQRLQGGCSISRRNGPAGTFGCLVASDNRLFVLGASHVLASRVARPEGEAGPEVGDEIYQSALEYRRPGARPIAYLSRWTNLPAVQDPDAVAPAEWVDADAAIAEITDRGLKWTTSIPQIGSPGGVNPRPYGAGRSQNPKYGQYTGLRIGTLRSPAANILAQDPSTRAFVAYRNHDLFFRRESYNSSVFATEGDSGAIVWDNACRAVGMIVATDEKSVLVSRWSAIERALNIGLLTQTPSRGA